MKLTFLGAAETVTGSSYLLETEKSKVLIDCGMFQGPRKLSELNHLKFQFHRRELDAILLTHAHIDHSGLLPRLAKDKQFKAPIYATSATRDLCEIMLPDSAHIQEEEMAWQNRKRQRAGLAALSPLYNSDDAYAILRHFQTVDYDERKMITEDISVRYINAGHILGAASIEVWVTENKKTKKITFSGDIGNPGQAIIRDPQPISETDYLLIETTYGDRLHKNRQETIDEFRQIIIDCIARKGNIVIPSFAVERTQEILYELSQLEHEGLLTDIPVFVDSPMAISATETFRRHPECYDDETWEILQRGDSPFDLKNVHFTRSVEESRNINTVNGAIIISASGMADAGRIRHHLKHNLWRQESHIIFVGYQAVGTLGRLILDGAKEVKLFGDKITVQANIHSLGGFSGHADQAGLLAWLSHFKVPPKRLFLIHGERTSMEGFQKAVKAKYGWESEIPTWIETIEL